MARKVISQELKNEIIELYMSKPMSLSYLENKYDLSHPTISKILKDVPKYTKAKIYNPNLNERFFEKIDCEAKAYYLGLIIADGNVFIDSKSNRQASISITVDQKDQYILETFKKYLNADTSIGHDGRGCCQFAVRSNLMAEDLEQYGVVPRKYFLTYLPKNIPAELMCHVLRGILDGDGNIKAKQTNNRNRYLHSISYCGSEELMKDIAYWCVEVCKLEKMPCFYTYTNRTLSEIKIQNVADMYKFGEYIYKNASIYLSRKKESYKEFKAHYNLT